MKNIYKLEKLANEYTEWRAGRLSPPKTSGEFVAWVDKRKVADINYTANCRHKYMEALSALKTNLLCSFCPFCGRDNSMSKAGCTSDDCTGVKLIKELEEVES